MLEFCCARKGSGGNALKFAKENSGAYFWCGTVRKIVKVEQKMAHHARIIFLKTGEFVVSACVKIWCDEKCEEKWWAPQAQLVIIETAED